MPRGKVIKLSGTDGTSLSPSSQAKLKGEGREENSLVTGSGTLMKKAMRRSGAPSEVVTDKLRSYSAAAKELGCLDKQVTQRWANNRAENSHLPFRRRERAMLRFRRMHSLQKFASIHASFYNLFNSQRSLSKRSTFKLKRDAALNECRSLLIS